MKLVFLSNYFNHHQEPVSKAFSDLLGGEYRFIATKPFPKQRLEIGYQDMNEKYPWILRAYESEEEKQRAIKIINEADVVILGSADNFYIQERLKQKKIVFRYSERIYKDDEKSYKFLIRYFLHKIKFRNYKNQYVLCASAYTPYDFSRSRAFLNKTYKWGYFPETIKYPSIDELLDKKEENSILWVGRFLSWKHPEYAVLLAKRLKDDGYKAKIKILGAGELEGKLKSDADKFGVNDYVEFLGSVPSDKVRSFMEKAQIFLFTSNKHEGWGAVLNEAMNSGCAVVASHACGSVPYLAVDKENALVFQSENFEDFYNKAKTLLIDQKLRRSIQKEAYLTIQNEWNAFVAVRKFVSLYEKIKEGNFDGESTGVCSKAEIIKDDWFRI